MDHNKSGVSSFSKPCSEEDTLSKILTSIIENNIILCEFTLKSTKFRINNLFSISSLFPVSRLLSYMDQQWNVCAAVLHIACIYRRPALIEMFLKEGAEVNLKDSLGRTPIHLIHDYWSLLLSVDSYSSKIQFRDYIKQMHDLSVICLEHLCSFGVDVNATTHAYHHQTALHLAARDNFLDCLNLLVKNGVNLEIRDAYGRTPLLVAVQYRNEEMVQKLICLKCNVNAKDNKSNTALHLVCQNLTFDNCPIMLNLLQNFADPNAQDCEGNTPMHLVASAGVESGIKQLLYYGGNPNISNVAKNTPLFCLLDKYTHKNKTNALSYILNETSQVRIVNSIGFLPRLLDLEEAKELKDRLLIAASRPSSLKRLSRQAIRKIIGIQRLLETGSYFENCDIPATLKVYILQLNHEFF